MARPPGVDWERMAPGYDRFRGPAEEAWLDHIVEMGGLAPGRRLLDVGCGTGRLAIPLRARGIRVFGLDASAPMLDRARLKEPRLGLVRGSALALPFRSKAFRTALAAFVVQHFEDPQGALAEMARVAKSAVVVSLEVPGQGDDILYEAFPTVHAIDAARFPSAEALAATMESLGLKEVEVRRRVFPGRLTPPEFLEAVRSRYISTLTLISETEFNGGVEFLERELPRRFGDKMGRRRVLIFVAGHA